MDLFGICFDDVGEAGKAFGEAVEGGGVWLFFRWERRRWEGECAVGVLDWEDDGGTGGTVLGGVEPFIAEVEEF